MSAFLTNTELEGKNKQLYLVVPSECAACRDVHTKMFLESMGVACKAVGFGAIDVDSAVGSMYAHY